MMMHRAWQNPAYWCLAGMLTLGLAWPSAPSAQAIDPPDPFYKNLLDEARILYQSGQHAGAIESLEIARFGFLDHPDLLLECHVYLAVCHIQMKNPDKARASVLEIRRMKLENRIAALNLPQDLTAKYAEIAAKLIKT